MDKKYKGIIDGFEAGKLSISAIAENLKVSIGFVEKYINKPVPRETWNPDKVNLDGLAEIIKNAESKAVKNGYDVNYDVTSWKFTVPTPKVVIDWSIGQKCTFGNSHGEQNPNCIYTVQWLNDGYVLVVPVENMNSDKKGLVIDRPRCFSKLVASNMKPTFVE